GHLELAVPGDDALDARRAARRPDRHDVARTDRAGHDLTRVTTEVLVGAADELHREPERLRQRVAFDLHGLEELEQRGAVEPRRPRAAGDDIVAVERAHRDRMEVLG